MIEALFDLCCGIMTGLGNMLHLNYMTVNVILFYYLEPIFTGLMLLLAILSKCKLPVRTPGIWFFWIVVGVVGLSLFLGGIFFFAEGYGIHHEVSFGRGYYNHIDQEAASLFYKTVSWLKDMAAKLGTTYEAINLILYVLFMPVTCIVSYVVMTAIPRMAPII